MRRIQVLAVLVALAFGFWNASWAVPPSGIAVEKVITPKEGLSNASVLAIAVGPEYVFIGTKRYLTVLKKDGSMMIWTPKNSALKFHSIPALVLRGTQLWATCRSPVAAGGTFRWDGLQWEAFEEIKDDMVSNYISCFHVDDRNMVWIGSEDQGINYYVHETNQFRKFGVLSSKKGLIDNRITCMASRPGELWIGTLSGVSVYKGRDGENDLFTNFVKKDGLLNEHIVALAAAPARVYAGTTMGLMVYENGNWRAMGPESGLADSWITSLALDGSDLWIGTKKGLQLMRKDRIEPVMDFRDGFPSNQIQCLAVGKQSDGVVKVFAGTPKGLVILRHQ
ncbi:hypothetical protein AUK22_10200 [bacterium CG2_30_54_10]|nr:MAG: hypothetical protein AUK22_10200 [bacterium CG2_30_54_10]